MTHGYVLFALSGVSIVLGFVALLTQKIYVDPNTHQPTEIDIPFFGKLKTNVPALAFVFLGFASAWFSFEKVHDIAKANTESQNHIAEEQAKDREWWQVSGELKLASTDANNPIDWMYGASLVTFPANPDLVIYPTGKFIIKVELDAEDNFQDIFEDFTISNTLGSVDFNNIDEEVEKLRMGKESSVVESYNEDKRIIKLHAVDFVAMPSLALGK